MIFGHEAGEPFLETRAGAGRGVEEVSVWREFAECFAQADELIWGEKLGFVNGKNVSLLDLFAVQVRELI